MELPTKKASLIWSYVLLWCCLRFGGCVSTHTRAFTLGGKPSLGRFLTNALRHIGQRRVLNRSLDCSCCHLLLCFLINFVRPWPLPGTECSFAVRNFYCKIKWQRLSHTPKPACLSFCLLQRVRWSPLQTPAEHQVLLGIGKE